MYRLKEVKDALDRMTTRCKAAERNANSSEVQRRSDLADKKNLQDQVNCTAINCIVSTFLEHNGVVDITLTPPLALKSPHRELFHSHRIAL